MTLQSGKPDQHPWVVVAMQPGNFFGMSDKAVDKHRLTTDSAQDIVDEAKMRSSCGQRITALGANLDLWYAIFATGDSYRGEADRAEVVEICTSCDQLRSVHGCRHVGVMTITQLASLGDQMIAVFEPMHPDERCNLFWHEGKASCQHSS